MPPMGNLGRLRGARVVYTDLDGTMLGRGGSFLHGPRGEPTTEPAAALLAALQAGIDVVPTSGRALRGLVTDARILGLGTVVAEMGALIAYDFGREVVECRGETPGEGKPVEIMERTGAADLLLRAFAGRLEFHTPWAAWREYTALFRGLVDTEEADALLARDGHGWLTLHDNGRLHGAHLGLARGQAHAYHLQPRGLSKGLAVRLDRGRRGFARHETAAIGDSVADLELAPEVGTFVLVGDALEHDPALPAMISTLDNVVVTERPQNLGWADALRAAVSD